MPKSANYLLIGSTEAYSGKSTVILGVAHELQANGINFSYAQPLGNYTSRVSNPTDADVSFISQAMKLSDHDIRQTLLMLDESNIEKRLLEKRDLIIKNI